MPADEVEPSSSTSGASGGASGPQQSPPAASAQPIFSVKPPEALKFGKDNVNNWKLWKQLWQHYCVVSNLDAHPPAFKKSLLISTMGIEALQKYNGCDPEDKDTAEDIINKLDKHIMGEPNETFERYKFNTRIQAQDESIEDYITALKSLVKSCNYCDCIRDSLLRDRIVLGVNNERTRTRLLQERKLTLNKCLDICKSFETSTSQLKVLAGKEVNKVERKPSRPANKPHSQKFKTQGAKPRPDQVLCKFCAQTHTPKKELCPAWGKECNKCKKMNHFSKCCPPKVKRRIHGVDVQPDTESEEEIISAVSTTQTINSVSAGPIYAEMELDGKPVKFQVDCGATVNVIPVKYVDKPLEQSENILHMYNESQLNPLGKRRLSLRNVTSRKKYSVEFEVVKEDLTPLLSRKAAEQMNLITVNYGNFKQLHSVTPRSDNMLHKYSSVFDDSTIGDLPGKVSIVVDEHAKPVQCPPRKVPVSVKPKLKEELSNLVDLKVITPVTEPTDWCSQISVQSKKNGNLRICLDPRSLNEALCRERYPLKTMDDVLPQLAKAKLFSKLDLAHGYWHCTLDNQSSYLTTFITPFGRYRWLRLPFGLNVSSEIFQRKLDESLEGLDGVLCVADDILVYGDTEESHDKNLENLLKTCQQKNIKLNKKKSVFKTTEVEFLGHVVTSEGLKPDPKKVEAILQMENPTDVAGIRRLQGTVTYLAKFLPRLSTVLEPLRRLTHQGEQWQWTEEQDKAMSELKKLVTTAPVLAYYDPAKELTIQCDASSTGLGAVLLQDEHPLAYASRALSDTETGYAQIEKECLAMVFALERFHQYTFGRKTTVHTDHKPLEMIVRKPLYKAPKRLQGMLLRLLQYDIEVIYKKGTEMHIADMLSRAYLPLDPHHKDQFSRVNAVCHLRISEQRLRDLQQATKEDKNLTMLKNVILQGWPDTKETLPTQVTPYFSYREELTVHDGLVFKGERVVVPESLRKPFKEQLHSSHLGGESMLRRARECIFWPNMASDIKQIADTCEACQTFPKTQQKEPMIAIETEYPWEKVGVDIFTLRNKDYLITVDYFSGFWEVDLLRSATSTTVIDKLKPHFARNGIPSVLISDNGPQFVSQEFLDFASNWDFEHCTSSPHHPKGNGKVESAVKAAEKMLTKCAMSHTDPCIALLEIRNTPTQGTGSSPAQRLLNRRTRTLIPATDSKLAPRGTEYMIDSMKLKHNKRLQAKQYNKGAREQPSLEEGDTVRLKPYKLGQKEWQKGMVTKRLDERSYEVETTSGTLRRNRVHLKKTSEPPVTANQIAENYLMTPTDASEPCESGVPASKQQPVQHSQPLQQPDTTQGSTPQLPATGQGTTPKLRRSSRATKTPVRLKDYVTDKK